MCTSADRQARSEGTLRDGTVATLRALPYDDPLAQYLVEAVQQEYVLRYGGRTVSASRRRMSSSSTRPPVALRA